MKINLKVIALLIFIIFTSCNEQIPKEISEEYTALPEKLDFNTHVKPILSDKCFACHGPDGNKVEGDVQLHSSSKAYAEIPDSNGKVAITPGKLSKSEVYKRIISNDENLIMPPKNSNLTLSLYEKAVLTKWIENGAKYEKHWAFIAPKISHIPDFNRDEVRNDIDKFVLSALQKNDLQFAPIADKETLLRRLSFDLTGLPPTLEEIDAFLSDTSSDAYEKQVDRLLSSQNYGEQMAANWMDLSRFADTHGYSVDRYRDMSPWRDWVIKAYNDNQPYDEFVTWQLAGDLMENPSKEMILATGFNRLHPQNMEGGIVNEEFLVEYMVDRANTVGQSLMGLTVACARCHDHKYDPITQKNVYEMGTFFNNINEAGQISWNNAMPTPTLMLPTDEQEKLLAYMDTLIEDKEQEIIATKEAANSTFNNWLNSKSFHTIASGTPKNGLVGDYSLNTKELKNKITPFGKATMKREYTEGQPVNLTDGYLDKGLLLNGDTWLDLKDIGIFGRAQSFTIGVWAKIPEDVQNGNIFHKGDGAILNAWRGYHLKIVDDKLEVVMAHTAPDNQIKEVSQKRIPKNKWTHFSITYDGSSKATGLKIYMDGEELKTEIIIDNLYKDILFRNGKKEPALQFGARLRGKGISNGVIDEIKVYNRELTNLEILQLANNSMLEKLKNTENISDLSIEEKNVLKEYYMRQQVEVAKNLYPELAQLRKTYVDSVEKVKEVMIMKETAPKQAYLLERGVYDARADSVFPKTPEFLVPMDKGLPKDRLGLARWLFQKNHPLTSRVAVNRMWQHFFRIGLVKTSEDFGNQGELPSHPELLDYLAITFQESNWDMKAFNKMIVMSRTYMQASTASEELLSKDPENRLLARGPSGRMTGEMLRDNALVASGLLNNIIGGESVNPYQPPGLWEVNGTKYTQDEGDNLYRRSLYTIWKRSIPNPTLATFDAPSRDVCTIRRQETNTPLQALVLLNDPTYIEAARVIGKEMTNCDNLKVGIQQSFRKLTGRKATINELNILLDLHEEEYQKFTDNPNKAKGWLNTGAYEINKQDDKALIAANAVVASTIMNADVTISKR
ncbi:Protein of unknown function (DUF1553) [Galbibacter orientalis DSM 19592]|uniref:DUF1553 domain-containing protein n=1 Tax=Galbibacter orientalis DSM 19592 TaxID=926559 RepID=I3CAV2_9FLAO|nr:DUF1553 domain-containing protein [Galbibacter orientalis]EIJ40745.1 Protein of unknown function (DUF1553) [Galbibacter orientalis DSM 19592]